MARRQILTARFWSQLMAPPSEDREVAMYCTLTPDEVEVVARKRTAAARLGYAVSLAYLRHPRRVSSNISRNSSTSRSNAPLSGGVTLSNTCAVTSLSRETAGHTRKSSDASMIHPPPARGTADSFPFFMALVIVGILFPTLFAACDADNSMP